MFAVSSPGTQYVYARISLMKAFLSRKTGMDGDGEGRRGCALGRRGWGKQAPFVGVQSHVGLDLCMCPKIQR